MDEWIIIFLTKKASIVELRNAPDAETTSFVRPMKFEPNEPSVKQILIGSEASQNQDLGTRPVNFSPPVRHMCTRARMFISLEYLIGSTTQTIMDLWKLCPRTVWAQTPYVYWKAEIRSTRIHVIIRVYICTYLFHIHTDLVNIRYDEPWYIE